MSLEPLMPSVLLLTRVCDYTSAHQNFRMVLVPHFHPSDPCHAYFAGLRGSDAELVRTNLAEDEPPVFDVVSLPANLLTTEEEARKLILEAIDDDAWQ